MDHRNMAVGMTLILKPARQAAYGMDRNLVRVADLQVKGDYLTPWVVEIVDGKRYSYRPSDFTDQA